MVFPRLFIVIVNWNLKNDLLACIDSLLVAGAETRQIIVVDNNSTDHSIDAVHSRYGRALTTLMAKENLGFAKGNNWGIRHALAQDAEWVLLLNNDTVVAPDMLFALRKATQQHPEYSIFSPLVFYFDQPTTIWSAGDRLIPGTLATYHIYHKKQLNKHIPDILDVDFVTGCGILINRAVFCEVGLLDTSTFMYAEEVDFIWRARMFGHKVACATEARMWHKVSMSSKQDQPKTRYLRIRNQIWFYRKYAQGTQMPIMFGFVLLRLLMKGIADIIAQRPTLISPLVRGWKDGWVTDLSAVRPADD